MLIWNNKENYEENKINIENKIFQNNTNKENLNMKKYENFHFFSVVKKYLPQILIAIAIIVGIFVRFFKLGEYPNALNVDEASAGYEAFSIMNFGIDRNANFLPVFLVAWGSGQNALLTYIMMPFILIFGLSTFAIRIPMSILGAISLFIFYCLLKRMTNQKIAIIGIIFLAICPWHIMKSRWGLESNLFPDLFLLSVFLIIKGLQDKSKICQIFRIYYCRNYSIFVWNVIFLFTIIFYTSFIFVS